jgi:hypothetical protein
MIMIWVSNAADQDKDRNMVEWPSCRQFWARPMAELRHFGKIDQPLIKRLCVLRASRGCVHSHDAGACIRKTRRKFGPPNGK